MTITIRSNRYDEAVLNLVKTPGSRAALLSMVEDMRAGDKSMDDVDFRQVNQQLQHLTHAPLPYIGTGKEALDYMYNYRVFEEADEMDRLVFLEELDPDWRDHFWDPDIALQFYEEADPLDFVRKWKKWNAGGVI